MSIKKQRTNPITYSQYMIAKRHIAEKLIKQIPRKHISNQHIIEVGPGTGRLTEFLSQQARRLTCVEVDYNFWKRLSLKYKNNHHVDILCGDFMDFELPSESYVLISNLPFFLARNMLSRAMRAVVKPKAIYVIIQLELYKELERDKEEYRYSIRVLEHMKKTDFQPLPKVDCVWVEIIPY